MVPTLLGIMLISFIIVQFVPGGPVERYLAAARQVESDSGGGNSVGEEMAISDEQILQLNRLYLFDQPTIIAYGMWLGVVPREYWQKDVKFDKGEDRKEVRTRGPRDKVVAVRLSDTEFELQNPDGSANTEWLIRNVIETEFKRDEIPEGVARAVIYRKKFEGLITGYLGESTRYNEPVWSLVRERLPVSMYYGFMMLIIVYVTSIPLGVIKALKHNTGIDNWSSILVFVGFAIPGYALGSLLVTYMAARWGWFPTSGFTSNEFEDLSIWGKMWDIFYHSILPLSCYVISGFAFVTLMMKNHLMDNLAADYVRTAVAKGVSFKNAVKKHAFRNSLIPIATNLGHQISLFLVGSFLIERIFDIEGFGLLGFESLLDRDYPVVMGILVLTATLSMLGNILSDILVALVDPRVRFQ